ncbi:MAG: hypothetical protein ABSB65_07135 [Candidatus Acidiferrales bacterium]|jgi:hypothetical protein
MINPGELWRQITVTRYTRALEAEVVRLRAENRALLNSILGIAGVPPITVPDSVAIGNVSGTFSGASRTVGQSSPNKQPLASRGDVKTQGAASAAPPARKRSWHQIYRKLELDSARKKPQETVETRPTTTIG